MGKRKKEQKTKNLKLLLETSVQISKFIPDEYGNILRNLPQNSKLYTSNFVLYEFKTGLIKNLIEFYYKVKLLDSPSLALIGWSKKYGKRELKNITILQALMARITTSISTQNTKEYLRLIEAIIFDLITNFDTEILSIVGDFGGDIIVKFNILSSNDYEEFLRVYNSRKIIPLDNFWRKHMQDLKKIIANKKVFDVSKIINTLYTKLIEIDKDVTNANKYPINKAIGDVVITTDCPKNLTITTTDKAFNELCPLLDKNQINLLKTPSSS